eukprot:scaffold77856_cov61-Phaeocystis_antarctica.AAC.2
MTTRLNVTTRLVGPRPQPTTRTPWPLRPDLSSQRWRPHACPVLPLFRLYIIRGKTGYTHSLSPSGPPNNTLNTRKAVHNKRIAGRGPCELTRTARIPPASCPAPPVRSC